MGGFCDNLCVKLFILSGFCVKLCVKSFVLNIFLLINVLSHLF